MDEDIFNMSVRKFLKKVGVTSQREIEKAVRDAIAAGKISDADALKATTTLSIDKIGLSVEIDGNIELK
ncbi:MAG: DUF6494 family protein [Alphaproteobacteria bacterium]|nr:DUF6494 family protein [Alphaproteobacteria bacterium]